MSERFSGGLELLVRQMRWEADGVVSVTLTRPDGSALPAWEPGAHLDLMLRPDLIRPYSLCSSPEDRDQWTVAVLLEPASMGGSRFIHETLRPGMSLRVAGPSNNFQLVDAPEYLFVGGGIGITPLVPMVRRVDASGKPWSLLYGGRRRHSMAFLSHLEGLGERVSVRPEDEYGLLDLVGALERLSADAAVYCCGPEPLIDAVEATCASAGRPAPRVERFKGKALEVDESGDTAFEVVIATTGERVPVPVGKSIIEALDDHGIWVPTSCTEGYCGVCETEVAGGVPDHRDQCLSDEERAANNRMMICVGRSKTPELVLKVAV